ncbi:MAG TPA: long-chain fatty acid--CoA ligase, partial [Bacteroidetes bacterium]|nr:long-chain fatty acid--CoA ligase [Bacteroidota bacterium]
MKNSPQRTIPNLLEQSCEKFSSNILLWEKKSDTYNGLTYAKAREQIYLCACGLMSLGIQKGDRIALISEGRNDWVIAEVGMLYAGAINVPISVKLDELTDLKFRLLHSGARMVIVSGGHVHKIRSIENDLPELEKIIILDGDPTNDDELKFSTLYKIGEEYQKTNNYKFIERWHSILESDPANICYTSGTTADPKGIILTHRNYTANVEQASGLLHIPQEYCSLLILPWDHCFAHTAGIYTLMVNGASMASVQIGKTPFETLKNVPVNIRESKPTFLLSVPALAKNFKKNIEKGIKEKGEKIESLFNRALNLGYKINGIGWDRGKNGTMLEKLQYKLVDFLIFKKIREGFGGRLEFFIGGGALLDIELQRFFYAIGIPMYQGYGLTEASPIISANVPKKHKLGSSGSIVPNLEVKICDENGNTLPVGKQGEIVIRGENVMAGYWKNEKATRETIREGWLYTGDLGYLDADNFLYVLGREKSLLISHDGEKYSPEGIEEALVGNSPFIEQAMLYNNQSLFTVALIVPNKEKILNYLKEKNLSTHTEEGQHAALLLIESEIKEYKTGGRYAGEFPERWLPAAVGILGEGFTEQNHFLNSTLKMVRGKITEYYKERIDFLYTAEGK